MASESYIIRVYRREEEDAKSLVGTIEIVETQEKRSFRDFNELKDILEYRDVDAKKHMQ